MVILAEASLKAGVGKSQHIGIVKGGPEAVVNVGYRKAIATVFSVVGKAVVVGVGVCGIIVIAKSGPEGEEPGEGILCITAEANSGLVLLLVLGLDQQQRVHQVKAIAVGLVYEIGVVIGNRLSGRQVREVFDHLPQEIEAAASGIGSTLTIH